MLSVVHRDIKPANILVNRVEPTMKFEVAICDFGFADFTDGTYLSQYQAGTIGFMAPELLRD